jgi:glucose-1-phosphate adenylyltransferase
MAVDSMISAGCIISGAEIRHSLLSNDVQVNDYSLIEDSVLLPGVTICRNCRIKRAVIDNNCDIAEGTIIGEDPDEDRERFYVTPNGVVLVTSDML